VSLDAHGQNLARQWENSGGLSPYLPAMMLPYCLGTVFRPFLLAKNT
jgi:hypothetical protein